MKPRHIYLIRHGESEANTDYQVCEVTPDWKIKLTEKGHKQAELTAKELLKTINDEIVIYNSPWIRCRQTTKHILRVFDNGCRNIVKNYEDPRLREQEWGNYREKELALKIKKERARFGTFFYRMPYGESGADVYDRISTFLETLHRDFTEQWFPENVIIVSHGLAIKVFLMRWLHWSVEEFENIKNPDNCEIIHLERLTQSWVLRTKIKLRRKYEKKTKNNKHQERI